jgi:Phage stabilisation protein
VRIPLGSQSYRSRALRASAQRLVNLFAEANPPGAESEFTLLGTPGLKPFAICGAGPIRGVKAMGGKLYAASGNTLYAVDAEGGATPCGTISGTGKAWMDTNGAGSQQLVIGCPPAAYVYTTTGGLVPITDPDFPGASSWAFLDGYGIFTQPGGDRFWITALEDFTLINGLDFATAESSPDDLVCCFVDHRELWLFGTETTEIWYNSGANDFPFERLNQTILQRGCAAAASAARTDNSVFWLGDDRVVYRAAQYTPQRISTHAMEDALRGYATVADAEAFTYTQGGHAFYGLTFAAAGATWVFDAATQEWHERESYGIGRWRASGYAKFGDRHIVGDCASGALYELDLDTFDEAGQPLVRRAASPPIFGADEQTMTMSYLQVIIDAGVGLANGQGSDPQMMVRWSDDGGETWSAERQMSMGKIGKYRQRARTRRLGRFRQRVIEVSVADPVKVAIIAASAGVGQGDGA